MCKLWPCIQATMFSQLLGLNLGVSTHRNPIRAMPIEEMSAYTKGVRALPLFILFACAIETIVANCVVGEFRKSRIKAPCPDGMTPVTSTEVCEAITTVNEEDVTFSYRATSCMNMHKVPFGCYFYGPGQIQFNSKENERCDSEQIEGTELIKASICQCSTTTTTTKPTTTIKSTTTTIKTSTSSTISSHVQLIVSESSRCPSGTVVLSNQQQCQRAQYSIASFSGTQATRFMGNVANVAVTRRPPGCFVDEFAKSQDCANRICIRFNDKADFSKHDQFPETTDFRAICAPASEADTNADQTQTAKAGTRATTTTTTSAPTTTTTSTLAGCEAQGKIYKSPLCPANTYAILSEDSCRKSVQRLKLNEVMVIVMAMVISAQSVSVGIFVSPHTKGNFLAYMRATSYSMLVFAPQLMCTQLFSDSNADIHSLTHSLTCCS